LRNLNAILKDLSPQAVYRYRLSLKQPILLAGKPHQFREGLVVHAIHEGKACFGEIAPLPGFSTETLAQAEQQLIRWCEGEREQKLSPSVGFGLSMLAFQPEPGKPGKQCRLITELSSLPQQSFAKGQVVKCKVARGDWQQEAAQISALLKQQPQIQLRLDANQQWDLDTALAFAERVKHKAIRFIEEPCRTLDDTQTFAAHQLLPVALDETLQQPEWPELIFPGLAALVIKPTLVGDIKRVMMLANLAQFSELELVISSAYESSLASGYLQRLAAMLAPDTAPGLDTLSMLEQDLLVARDAPGRHPLLELDGLEPIWKP